MLVSFYIPFRLFNWLLMWFRNLWGFIYEIYVSGGIGGGATKRKSALGQPTKPTQRNSGDAGLTKTFVQARIINPNWNRINQ